MYEAGEHPTLQQVGTWHPGEIDLGNAAGLDINSEVRITARDQSWYVIGLVQEIETDGARNLMTVWVEGVRVDTLLGN